MRWRVRGEEVWVVHLGAVIRGQLQDCMLGDLASRGRTSRKAHYLVAENSGS